MSHSVAASVRSAVPLESQARSWPIGIVGAGDEELSGLERRLQVTQRVTVRRCRLVRGNLGQAPVVLARTGEGRRNAEDGVRTLIEREAVGRIAIVGFSGGLSPGLSAGTLLLADRILDGHEPVHAPDRSWSERISRQYGLPLATLVSVDRVLGTPACKRECWDGLPQDLPAAADLETAAMASVAAAHGVPFVAIRSISDPAEEALPLDFNRCTDASGSISRAKVVGRAALNPKVIPGLWRLRGRARACSESLADLLCRSIEGESS